MSRAPWRAVGLPPRRLTQDTAQHPARVPSGRRLPLGRFRLRAARLETHAARPSSPYVWIRSRAGRLRWPSAETLVPGVIALAIGLWDLGAPPVWRDEAATMSAAGRSLTQLAHLLQTVDAVHGLYYALTHAVISLFGLGEVALRLPSVVAGALAAAGVGALGRALGNPRTGLYGGVLMATMPVFSRYVQEARPYPLTMVVAIGVTLLLLRAARKPSRRAFAAYGLALAGLAYVNLFAFLLAGAHGIYMVRFRGQVARWCGAVALAVAAVAPLAWVASRQSAQVGWIPRPGLSDAGMLAVQLFGDLGAARPAWVGVAPLAWALALAGVAWQRRAVRRGEAPEGGELLRLALPWLIVPPLVLLTASWAAHPVYVFRYVFCCVPAAALLAGAGLAALPGKAALAALAAFVGLSVPGQLATRGPDGRQDDPRPVVALLASAARPGDGVMFVPGKVRKYAMVYPGVFGRLDDVALARSPQRDGSFAGRELGRGELARRVLASRLAGLRTLWVVGHTGKSGAPNWRLDLVRQWFVLDGRWTSRGLFVVRYRRPATLKSRSWWGP